VITSTAANTSTNTADDLGVPVSGEMANARAMGNNASSATAAPHVISPSGVPGDAADEQHGDFSRALFGNDTAAVEENNIPSQHFCPMIQEPPFDAIHFDVPSANGTTTTPKSQQVYEKSALYRFIGTQGELSLQRTLTHPFTRVRIAQNLAWDCVRSVAPALQETLHRERSMLSLLLKDENPLNDNDRAQYDTTMRGCVAW
jgi:hypothetical protein